MTEDALESRGVTKGARHKIVLSIKKLRDRPSTLAQLEQEVVKGGGLRTALEELKNMLLTPIKLPEVDCHETEDVPKLFARVLGKSKSAKITFCPETFTLLISGHQKLVLCFINWKIN